MKIAVRMDDITPDMNRENFFRMKELLEKYQVKPLLGIVPQNMDEHLKEYEKNPMREEEFWLMMQELSNQGYILSMHGYQHIYTTKKGGVFPLNHFSEFAGLPYNKQYEMLKKGKEILLSHGINPKIFMAPGHSFDKNTLRALKALSFEGLTDGFGKEPYVRMGLCFYPISFLLKKTMSGGEGYSTLTLHTDTMKDSDFHRIEEYFQRPENTWISYSDYLAVNSKKRSFLGNLKEWSMAFGKHCIGKVRGIS